jgi:hypothetical protein
MTTTPEISLEALIIEMAQFLIVSGDGIIGVPDEVIESLNILSSKEYAFRIGTIH